jgi:HD-GYP domain-containing protein (c-di-GMP phosphodiesterase class II)
VATTAPATPASAVWPAPDLEAVELIEASRERASTRLVRRDLVVSTIAAAGFLAIAVPLALLADSSHSASPFLIVTFIVAYAFASRVRFEIGIGFAIPTQLVFVPMLFLLPPSLAPLLVAAGFLLGSMPENLRGQWHLERAIVLVSNGWHALGPALLLVAAGSPSPDWRQHWPLFAAALVAQFVFDLGSSAARAASLGVSIRPHLPAVGLAYLVDLALAPLGLLVAYAAFPDRPYAFLLALPLLGLIGFFARERRGRVDHAVELGHAYRGTALLLGDVVEADDAYTGSHSRHVVDLVLTVCDRLALSTKDRRDAEFTALLHDVGKIRIPSEIINKPGPLDADERAVVELHTIHGEEMLEKVGGVLGEVGHLVRSCHERWDGAGYPDRLAGEAIPLVARIVCACDAFSAMTTDRPYRNALSEADALAELQRCSGTQFDPAVVDALVAVAG